VPALELREGRPDDLPVIHAMLCAIARETGLDGRVRSRVEDLARDGFGDRPAFSTLMAVQGEAPVGMLVHFPEYSSWRGERGCYVLDLYVAPQARSLGVGRLLLVELARRAAAQGAAYLRLNADRANAPARAFYSALGFAESTADCQFLLGGTAFASLAAD
jgi:ribosomal protein S18 acetylase RimI-like enzyme